MKKLYLLCFLFTNFMDANAQAVLVKDIYPGLWGGLNPSYGFDSRLIALNDKLVLIAEDGVHGEELHIYNTTSGELKMVKDIRNGNSYAEIYQMRETNSKIFFACDDDINGLELWVSDGTSSGTFMLKNINPTGDGVYKTGSRCSVSPNGIFFTAKGSAEGEELWFSDGTISNTKIVKDLRPGSGGSFPYSLYYHAGLGKLFFAADNGSNGTELYISDGTESGTKLLKDLISGSSSTPTHFTAFNNKVLFTAKTEFDFNTGKTKYETYISDGTTEGTLSIFSKYIAPSSPKISNYHLLGNKCVFTSDNVLYITDGKASGTKLITSQLKIDEDAPFIQFNNKMIFVASDSLNGEELYITDGTAIGTKLIKDINPGIANSSINDLRFFDNKIFFIATTAAEEKQVWQSDGTADGTKMAFRLNPDGSSYISNLTVLGNNLYFIGNDGSSGSELWKYTAQSVATYDLHEIKLQIYPNPFTKSSIVQAEDKIETIEIYDMNNKKVYHSYEHDHKVNIDLNIPPACYLLVATLESGKVGVEKIVVE